MAFEAGDQLRICNALNLEREQQFTGSRLKALMDTLENYDVVENTTLVAQVRALLTDIESLKTTIETAMSDSDLAVKIVDIRQRIRTEYFEGVGPTAGYTRQLDSKRQKLRTLLDPNDVLRGVSAGGNLLW